MSGVLATVRRGVLARTHARRIRPTALPVDRCGRRSEGGAASRSSPPAPSLEGLDPLRQGGWASCARLVRSRQQKARHEARSAVMQAAGVGVRRPRNASGGTWQVKGPRLKHSYRAC